MREDNTVSIIVPVYNAEGKLKDCIDSIINQTYKNLEIILINDGSADNSGIICDEYSRKDLRVKTIHQNNSGPSISRNTGLKAATGKFIQFVDADDFLETDMTSKLVDQINKDNVQLVLCGSNLVYLDQNNIYQKEKVTPSFQGINNINEFMGKFGELYKNSLINSPCNKLFIRDIIYNFNLLYKEDLNMGEDLLFNIEYLNHCNNVCVIQDPLYNYVKGNNNSLTGTFKENFFYNQQMLFKSIVKFLSEKGHYCNENKLIVNTYYTNSIVGCFSNLFHEKSKLSRIQKKKEILNIIKGNHLKNNFHYFNEFSFQTRITGRLMQYELVNGIYMFYKIKGILKYYMYPIFNLLKNKHNK